jgi:chaperonin GroES
MRKNTKNTKDKCGIKPLGDKVFIKPLSTEDTTTPSGIIIPDTVEQKQTDRGKVVAVGDGKYDDNGNLIPMSVKKGDIVMFQWGDKMEYEGEEYFIVNEGNILAVIK